MPFPVAAAIGGVSLLSSLFGKKKSKAPRPPDFFVNNPDELRALIRQSTQSQYAGLESSLRESLSNAGVLSPSSLGDALTKGSIALGQETLGKYADLGLSELERARAFQTQDYLAKLEDMFQVNRETNRNIYESLGGIGIGLGDLFAQKGSQNDALDEILGILKGKKKKTAAPYTPDFGGGKNQEGGVTYG